MRLPITDEEGLALAELLSEGADCSRRQVGVLIALAESGSILSVGTNQAPEGVPGCASADGCPRARSSVEPTSSYDTGSGVCISVHAEQYALMRADWDLLRGATLFSNHEPCDGCARIICASPLARIVTPSRSQLVPSYRDEVYARLTRLDPVD